MANFSFDPQKFTAPKAKPLPIFLLLDISGSMDIVINPEDVHPTGRTGFVDGHEVEFVEGGITRISVLNDAVKKMLRTLSKYERDATEFLVSIVTFGEETHLLVPPSPASDVRFSDLQAAGNTPLDLGLKIAKELIEDKAQIPSRSYRPLIILVSDGKPDEGWQEVFNDFIHNGRTAKCDRMALAINNDADRTMLAQFIEGTGHQVFEAETADEITKFFKFVTMTTVQRTLSQNPNVVPQDKEVENLSSLPLPKVKDEDTSAAPKVDDDDDEGYW